MPCFLVGENVARCFAAANKIPVYSFSHQAGHIMAALASINQVELAQKEFLAFHVSGGTTDLLYVKPDTNKIITITQLASSLDLKAGQAVDRVGVMLGLSFPAGKALDALSLQAEPCRFGHKPELKNGSCCLSGIENICKKMIGAEEEPAKVALCCLDYIGKTLEAMVAWALEQHPGLPVLFCGGVMSNTLLRERLSKIDGALFGKAEFSSDNAAGVAILGWNAK
jgi:N6-L-threonylcarbamoyladenine synthase